MIVAGIGLRPGAEAAEIVVLVERAARAAGRRPALLAVPCFRRHETGPHRAAETLSLGFAVVERAALEAEQPRCPTRSATAAARLGLAAVAEACALAAAGPGSVLLLPRIASANATCALAIGGGE